MTSTSGSRIGSLCSGYGGLDMAVQQVYGGTLAWVVDNDPGAARILAHHHPGIPNLGDLTAIDWHKVPPVDILTAGFPCQDVSSAGRRAGIADGTRSGLWFRVAHAVEILQPALVIIENVEGLLSARADRGVESTDQDVEAAGPDALRALGCVLGDLADRGYDTWWCRLGADEVGAPHRRRRIFIAARPADTKGARLEGPRLGGRPAFGDRAAADSDRLGGQRHGSAGLAAQRHPSGAGLAPPDAQSFREGEPTDEAQPVPDGGHARPLSRGGGGRVVSDTQGDGRDEGRTESAGIVGGSDAPLGGAATPADTESHPRRLGDRDGRTAADTKSLGHRSARSSSIGGIPAATVAGAPADPDGDAVREQPVAESGSIRAALAGHPGTDADGRVPNWGRYAPAIRRWEQILGRPAPAPTEPDAKGQPRLSPRFVEWMMGLPDGWVCDVPAPADMTPAGIRNAQLRNLGNGVVPQQAAQALRLLLDQMERAA